MEFYTGHGPRIFRNRSKLRVLRHLLRAKYGAGPLRESLREVFGERTFGESTKRLVITSYNLRADDVYLFRTPHLPTLKRDWRESAVNVALATSAAPTYMPGMPLDGARLVDGGLWANNPTMVALTEAVGPLGVPLEAIRAFSLGTTTKIRNRHRRLDHGGLLPWAGDAVEILMRAQSESANKQARHFLGKDNVLRLNPAVPAGVLALDKVDINTLYGLASHVSRDASPAVHRTFCDHRAPVFAPFYSAREE